MQTSYCNWWDAEEPRKWRVASGEKKNRSRPGRDEFRPATTKERGTSRSRAKKQPRGIEDQKSSQERIKIRTLKTAGLRHLPQKNAVKIPRDSLPRSGQVRHN